VCRSCGSAKAAASLSGDLNEEGIQSLFLPDFPDEFLPERVYVLPGNLSAGFEYPQEKFTLITYGSRAQPLQRLKGRAIKMLSITLRSFIGVTILFTKNTA
jgi:hypothetical protein